MCQSPVKTRLLARVTSWPMWADEIQNGIAIAVEAQFDDLLHVAGGGTFSPIFLARSAPKPRISCRKRPFQRLAVRIGKHEHGARLCILHDDRNQPSCRIVAHSGKVDLAFYSTHRTGTPLSRRYDFTSRTLVSAK